MKDEIWYIIWEIYMMKYNIRWNILWFNDETIFNTATEKRQASSTFETGENWYPFVFISSLVVCTYVKYFFDLVRNKIWKIATRVKEKYLPEFIKRRSNVPE